MKRISLAIITGTILSQLLSFSLAQSQGTQTSDRLLTEIQSHQVVPGYGEANRKHCHMNLVNLAKVGEPVGSLWKRFLELEKSIPVASQPQIADQCNSLAKDIEDSIHVANKKIAGRNASLVQEREQIVSFNQAKLSGWFAKYSPSYGPDMQNRYKVWKELKALHASGRNVVPQAQAFLDMEKLLRTENVPMIHARCKRIADSIGLRL